MDPQIEKDPNQVEMFSEEKPKPAPKVPSAPQTPIQIDQAKQMLVAKDNNELVRMIRVFMKGQAFPKSLDTEEKIITAWQAAASLNVPPNMAIPNMAIINGSLTIWGQLPKALAEATGQLTDFQLIMVDQEYNEICLANKNLHQPPWAAIVKIKRGQRSTNEYFFTVEDARTARLLDKTGPWKDYRKVMLARRATAQAIKFEFPDALLGLSIAEYDMNAAPDLKDVSPRKDVAAEINKTLNEPAWSTTAQVIK